MMTRWFIRPLFGGLLVGSSAGILGWIAKASPAIKALETAETAALACLVMGVIGYIVVALLQGRRA